MYICSISAISVFAHAMFHGVILSVLLGTWCCSPGICKSCNEEWLFNFSILIMVAIVYSSLQALVLLTATVIQRLCWKFNKNNKH